MLSSRDPQVSACLSMTLQKNPLSPSGPTGSGIPDTVSAALANQWRLSTGLEKTGIDLRARLKEKERGKEGKRGKIEQWVKSSYTHLCTCN